MNALLQKKVLLFILWHFYAIISLYSLRIALKKGMSAGYQQTSVLFWISSM